MSSPNKIKTFFRLMHHNSLPTLHYLPRIGLDVNPICHVCGHLSEDINHVFFRNTNSTNFGEFVQANCASTHIVNTIQLSTDNWNDLWHPTKGKPYNTILPWDVVSETSGYKETTINFNKKNHCITFNHVFHQATEYHLFIGSENNSSRHTSTILVNGTLCYKADLN